MGNGWNQAEALADKHTSSASGLFVKLANNGDKVVGAFLGDPSARETHWSGERYEACVKNCRFCGKGERPNLRVAMNFYVPADQDVKVIEGGVTWFKDVIKARQKYGLDSWLFEIERHGAAGDSKTRYSILPETEITPDLHTAIGGLQLHDLVRVVSGDTDTVASDTSHGTQSGTVNPRTASQFTGRLKALPKEAVNTFLERFDVQRIRDVQVTDEDAARALVETLEATYAPADPAASGEVDPFG